MWIEGPANWRATAAAAPSPVTVRFDDRGLAIHDADGREAERWPLAALRVERGAARFALSRAGAPGVVEIADAATRAAFEAATRALPRAGSRGFPAAFAVTLVGMAGVIVVVAMLALKGLSGLVGMLAPLVPEAAVATLDAGAKASVLDALGTDESRRCTGPQGDRALGALTRRLADAGGVRSVAWSVGLWRSPIPNAMALPGGTIVITDALVARAGSADAFAGVLAHEIGHVHHRDGLKALLHDVGLMAALAVLVGDASGIAAAGGRAVIGASYSREAERAADAFSVDAVAAAGGDPTALAPFLASLDEPKADAPGLGLDGLLATHPLTGERSAAIAGRAAGAVRGSGPLLPDADWAAIRSLCE